MSQLPKGWYVTEIKNILAPQKDGKLIHQGWSPRCHVESAGQDEWGVLKTTAIQDGYFLEEHNKKLPIDKEPKERIEVKPGDLLMTNAGPRKRCGVTTFVQDVRSKLMLSGKMYRMRFDESKVYPKYVELFLRTQDAQKEIDQRKTGMSESGLNLTQQRFLSVPVVMCSFEEQKRIADKLDSVLAKVEAAQARLDKIPAILKRFRQSVLAAATSGELTQDWRDKNFTNEWETKSLIDLVDEKPRNGRSPKGVNYETSFRNLTLSATTQGKFVEGCFKFVEMDIDKDSHLWVKNGDILIQRANSLEYVGVSALYDGEDNQYVYPDLMMKCRANDKVKSKYLHYCLLSEAVRKYFRNNATGTAGNMPKINQATVSGAPINVPSLKEQVEIISRVEILFEHANKLDKHYNAAKVRLDKLTQSILAKAFRGELLAVSGADLAPVDSRSSVEILI